MFDAFCYKNAIPKGVDQRGFIELANEEKVKPVGNRFGIDLRVVPEKAVIGRMYETRGCWSRYSSNHFNPWGGHRYGKIYIADKADEELSDDALEGLIYIEASRIILYHLASGFGPGTYSQILSLPAAELDVRLSAMHKALFDISKLPPYISETMNIDYREKWAFREQLIQANSEYINALSRTMPEIAAEIVKKSEFGDELRLDAPL